MPPREPLSQLFGSTSSSLIDQVRSHDADKKLRWLELAGSDLTDAGLVHLTGLNELEVLDVSGAAVTATGIQQLAELKKLKTLRVRDTKLTGADIERLKQTLPNCQIEN